MFLFIVNFQFGFLAGDADAFYAYMGANVVNPSRTHVIIFDVAITNESDGYIPNLGGFIAPMNGVYNFNWNGIAHENNNIFTEISYFTTHGKCVCASGDVSYIFVTAVNGMQAKLC